MTDTTTPLHPGALYTYKPEGFDCTVLSEVVSVDDDGTIRCDNHLSSDPTQATPPLTAVLDPGSFGKTGEYVYAGDIRDHQNNPDVGDVFLWVLSSADNWELFTAEIVRFAQDSNGKTATVLLTWTHNGSSWEESHPVADIVSKATYVGYTRPMFDTPERYSS